MVFIALDTGVIVEYANIKGIYHIQATAIFNRINEGRLTAILSPPTIAELYYVLKRLYDAQKIENSDEKAYNFCEYVYYHPSVKIAEMKLKLLIEAGKIKHDYGIALTDCYVLAVSKEHKCSALFRHREFEIEQIIKQLVKSFRIVFLEDYV